MRVVFLLVSASKVKGSSMARFFRQKKTSPPFMHSKGHQEKSVSNSYDLVAILLDDSEPENQNGVLFELHFTERIRHVLRPCTNETGVLLGESEFPAEEKKFSKSELSKMAIDGMLSEICLAPASRQYFANEISSFTQRVVEEVGGEEKGKLVVSAEMEVVTEIYTDERMAEGTGLDQKE